jgi:ArsR family transcriptional regulator, arsenate/arsenite/antimonite-responsive transcriptional repressor / arsenate reductase (thioredoxin)
VWRRASRLPAVSAGTHPADRIDPRAIDTAARHRLRLPRRRPTHLQSVRRPGDVIVCVCDQAYEELRTPGDVRATAPLHWSVPDPVRIDTDDAFEHAFAEIDARVRRLASAIPVP